MGFWGDVGGFFEDVGGGFAAGYDWLTDDGMDERKQNADQVAQSFVGQSFSELPPWLRDSQQQNIGMLQGMAGGQNLMAQKQAQDVAKRAEKQQQAMLASALGPDQASTARTAAQGAVAAKGSVPGMAKTAMLQEQQGAQNLLGAALAQRGSQDLAQQKAKQQLYNQLIAAEYGREPGKSNIEKGIGAAASILPFL